MPDWYVDSSAAAGGDGSEATPWDTLANINWGSISAGDAVILSGTFYETMQVGASGSAGTPITIDCSDALIWPSIEITGWSQVNSSEVYSKALADGNTFDVFEDGARLNPEAHYSDSEATIEAALDRGDYTVKQTPNTVYIRCSDGAAPSTHTIRATDRDGADGATGAIDLNSQDYITLIEPKIKGAYWNSGEPTGIYIDNACTGIKVFGGNVSDSAAILHMDGGSNIVIDGLTAHNIYQTGIFLEAEGSTLSNVRIRNCYIRDVARVGRYNGVNKNFNMDADGIGIGGHGGTVTNVYIEDNIFERCGPQYKLDRDWETSRM